MRWDRTTSKKRSGYGTISPLMAGSSFPISNRDLELIPLDRGPEVDHTTVFRWTQAYAAELEKRIRPNCA